MSVILNDARKAAGKLPNGRSAADIQAALDCLAYYESNSPMSGEAEQYAETKAFWRLAREGLLKNLSFNKMLDLLRAYAVGEIIALPFAIGSRVYRVYKAYLPKEPTGWETTWKYEVVPYSLEMYMQKDPVFATEHEAKEELKWRLTTESFQ